MFCKAQAAIEFMLVFGIALLILIPTFYIFQDYSIRSKDQISTGQLSVIGNDLVNAAETVYFMGLPARLTLELSMPEGVTGMRIEKDWSRDINELVFTMRDNNELSFRSNVNINGTFERSDYSQGLKKILLETKNTSTTKFVHIHFVK